MMLKKTALTLALGLGLAAGASATTTTETIKNLGTIAVPSVVSFSSTPFGPFLDAYNFTLSGATYSSGFVTSLELPKVSGIDNLEVKLWSGTYTAHDDYSGDTLKTTLAWSGTSTITKYGFGTYTPGNYFYTISGTGNGGTSGSSGLGIYGAMVQVTAVPEPESYAMLLAGLGVMGTIARRRSKAKAG